MPRKQIIKRKVRRLTPTEIDYLIRGVVALDNEIMSEPNWFDKNDLRNYEKADQNLRGFYDSLAIIEEE